MIYELTVHKLGKLLKELSNEYNINLLVKRKLSGGFITITGEVDVEYFPTEQKTIKGNNIIGLKVKNSTGEADLKITGIKDSLFKVEVAPSRLKEVNIGGLSMDKVKESKEECKVRVDEDLIFTVPAPYEIVEKLI
ncbi:MULTISPECIES: UDP-N-acetylglucosamine pyrophosphorylase [unclassified Clostridium]|uniref:UDP-N-acetylglucosamine pyrophosphorylase n=1 Tax=unclassified Clostridium TaxID=2614128 RepID=UPI001C8B312F|nr:MULTISPECIES: UDP-N-acetylglucosamine pyrophosphorylase [unclassified Clostridium]MBX9137427.1 UDP-N-acetylglucosamine pyrophosphorylase [Clostridium sp. K12(2020)]MBX9144249.1 UDP-N-acetylglucosamine pyrophosphorylase [Clostridium sp. K13]